MDRTHLELAVELRRALHAHPELSNHEEWTRAELMRFLRVHTDLAVIDRENWFYAVYRAPDPKRRIAFRADFDALPIEDACGAPYASKIPGVGHKCGHDGHSAALAAFAMEVDANGCENDVYFIFQHAEETGYGAKECAPLITEEKIDEVFAFHNWPGYPLGAVCIRDGAVNCASRGMTIRMVGTPSHASMPECGKNPAFALATIVNEVPALLDLPWKALVLATVIGVKAGEKAFGTQASEGELYLTIRAELEAELDALAEKIEAMVQREAARYGLEWSVEYCDCFPETANDPASADKVRAAARALSCPVCEMERPERGSEDFGYFLKRAPGAIFELGAGEDYPQLHTAQFDFPDTLIEIAVAMFTRLAAG